MSRIAKNPIKISKEVECTFRDGIFSAKLYVFGLSLINEYIFFGSWLIPDCLRVSTYSFNPYVAGFLDSYSKAFIKSW